MIIKCVHCNQRINAKGMPFAVIGEFFRVHLANCLRVVH